MMAAMAEDGTGELTWSTVAERLRVPGIYWLHTTRPSGAPHACPVWGVVVEGDLYVYTRRDTVKADNLRHDARALVHLESGADVVIVEGSLSDLGHPRQRAEVVHALAQKYVGPDERPFLPSENPTSTRSTSSGLSGP
jgi:hypothetical protein